MLSGGYGELKEKLIRLGHMGPASRSLYPLVAVSALAQGLARPGCLGRLGAGTQAVMEVLAASLRRLPALDAVRLTPFSLHRPETVEQATEPARPSSDSPRQPVLRRDRAAAGRKARAD